MVELILMTDFNMGTGIVAGIAKKALMAAIPKEIEKWNMHKLPNHLKATE